MAQAIRDIPATELDSRFLDALEDVVLSPSFIDRVLDATFAHDPNAERASLIAEDDRLTREIENLTRDIAAGGDIPALAAALAERDKRLETVAEQLAKPVNVPDRDVLRAALELRTADWRNILRGPYVAQARVVLQHLIDLPIKVINQPVPKYIKKGDTRGTESTHGWQDGQYVPKWVAAAKPEGLTIGLIQSVASPRGCARVGAPETFIEGDIAA
jgi:hypothetical protein